MTDRHAAMAANDGASAPVSKLRVAANDNDIVVGFNAGFGFDQLYADERIDVDGVCEDDAEYTFMKAGRDRYGYRVTDYGDAA